MEEENLRMAGEEGEEEKRLVDLRRSSLMASPQVKIECEIKMVGVLADSTLELGTGILGRTFV